jgi:hypothetical protein
MPEAHRSGCTNTEHYEQSPDIRRDLEQWEDNFDISVEPA